MSGFDFEHLENCDFLPEPEENGDSFCAVEDRTFCAVTASLDVHSPFKAESGADKSFENQGYHWGATDLGFPVFSPGVLDFGDYAPYGTEVQNAWTELPMNSAEKCSLDGIGSEMQQSSSSVCVQRDVDCEANLALSALDCKSFGFGSGSESPQPDSQNTGHSESREGAGKLVDEILAKLRDIHTTGPGTEVAEQKEILGNQRVPEVGCLQEDLPPDLTLSRTCCKEEFDSTVDSLQHNLKEIVTSARRLSKQEAYFTPTVRKEACKTGQMVKVAAWLLTKVVTSISHIERLVDTARCEASRNATYGDGLATMLVSTITSTMMSSGSQDSSTGHTRVGGESDKNVESVTVDEANIVTPAFAALGAQSGFCVSNSCYPEELACGELAGESGGNETAGTIDCWLKPDAKERSSSVADLLPVETSPPNNPLKNPESVPDESTSGSPGMSEEERSPSVGLGAVEEDSDEGEIRGGEELPVGSYILMDIDNLEFLNEQTHSCDICSKVFKRDANLRMHMRSHGGKYKCSGALTRMKRAPKLAEVMVGAKPTRYSCPSTGCNRNKKHPKFQALKTMLCLKNHYRRSHCPKTLKCSICNSKQFSVVADLKTHEKHCGSDKWVCSCGTTFSRKEKLYGHVSLFVGHTALDTFMGRNLHSEVDTGVGTVPAVQVADEKYRLGPQTDASSLWQDWKDKMTYKTPVPQCQRIDVCS